MTSAHRLARASRPAALRAQRGISLLGLAFWIALGVGLVIVGARVLPTAMEYQAIRKAATRAAQGDSIADVRRRFDTAASADYIESIGGKDLDVTKTERGFDVSFAYEKEIPLAGPAWLLLKYAGSASGKAGAAP
jgi:hypothetical protein